MNPQEIGKIIEEHRDHTLDCNPRRPFIRVNQPPCQPYELALALLAQTATSKGAVELCNAQETEILSLRGQAEKLAAALALALYDAHPVYSNTAGHHGGVGGQAITHGCSFTNPGPDDLWTQGDMLSIPLREYVMAHPEVNLDVIKELLKDEALKALGLK